MPRIDIESFGETAVYQNNGTKAWSAQTFVTLTQGKTLRITTFKAANGDMATQFTVGTLTEADGFVTLPFSDFTMKTKIHKPQCTQRRIGLEHGNAIEALHNGDTDKVMARLNSFYRTNPTKE